MSAIVSANEAAHRFGLSEKTVRRWIAAGKLTADKSGRAYRVSLSEVAALIGQDTAHDSGPSTDTVRTADTDSAPNTADSRPNVYGIAELVALVDRLQAEAREHAATAAMWQERAGTLADRLALAEGQLAALAAPQQPQDASESTEDQRPSLWLSRLPARSWAVYGAAGIVVLVLVIGLVALLTR